jgi:hypothetical protein
VEILFNSCQKNKRPSHRSKERPSDHYHREIVKEPVSVLGVHIAAKVVWLAGVSPEGDLVSDQTDTLLLAGGGMTE